MSSAPVRHEKTWLLGIMLTALLARLLYLYLQNHYGLVAIKIVGPDARRYLDLAQSLWQNQVLAYDGATPMASDVPGFPLFLVAVRALFGPGLLAIQLAQVALSCATVALVWWLGRRVFSPRAALLAAAATALYPLGFFYVVTPLTETLFTFWLILFLALYALADSPILELAAGLAAGLAAMCRPVAAAFAALLCLWNLFAPGRRRRAIMVGLGVAIVILPWATRNLLTFGEFIPLTTRGGYELYVGNGPGATGGTGGHHSRGQDISFPQDLPPGLNDSQRGRELAARALDHIKNHPEQFIALLPHKIWNMWRPTWAKASLKNWLIGGIPYLLLIALTLIGLATRPWIKPAWSLLGILIFYLVFHALFFGIIRYRAPIEPILCLWAGAGAAWLWERKRKTGGTLL